MCSFSVEEREMAANGTIVTIVWVDWSGEKVLDVAGIKENGAMMRIVWRFFRVTEFSCFFPCVAGDALNLPLDRDIIGCGD